MNTKTILRYTVMLLALDVTMTACAGAGENFPGTDELGESGDMSEWDDDDDDDDADEPDGGQSGDDGAGDDGADDETGEPEPAEPMCGDGVLDEELGEQCDDGNADELDGCMSNCGVGPTAIELDYFTESDVGPWVPNGNSSFFGQACPEGQVIIGVDGRDGAHIDQVRPRCGVVMLEDPADGPPAVHIEPAEFLGPQGGNGGGAFSLMCGDDEAVVGLTVRDTGNAVERLTLRCAKLELAGDGLDEPMSLALGAHVATGTVGTQHHDDTHSGNCPAGQVATRHHGQSDNSCIIAYGLTCRPITLL